MQIRKRFRPVAAEWDGFNVGCGHFLIGTWDRGFDCMQGQHVLHPTPIPLPILSLHKPVH
jgi:hypothetical protein